MKALDERGALGPNHLEVRIAGDRRLHDVSHELATEEESMKIPGRVDRRGDMDVPRIHEHDTVRFVEEAPEALRLLNVQRIGAVER